MSELLNATDLATLARPFALIQHEFLKGKVYIKEVPICERIEEVDPAWQFMPEEIINRDGIISVRASLQIKGVTRGNTGTQNVVMTKDGNNEANEAEKSATTDSLKRCARLFGIGRYLLETGSAVSDSVTLDKWLKDRYASTKPIWWNVVYKQLIDHPHFGGISNHMTNALKRLLADNILTPGMDPESVIQIVLKKYPTTEGVAL